VIYTILVLGVLFIAGLACIAKRAYLGAALIALTLLAISAWIAVTGQVLPR
jgi:hypothetical protein